MITTIHSWKRIYEADSAPAERVVTIFGAGSRRDRSPTAILRDHVQIGINLYFGGKMEKLLMNGDNAVEYYNAPEAIRQYSISLAILFDDIVLDYAGRRI